jgi:hypothetical protein
MRRFLPVLSAILLAACAVLPQPSPFNTYYVKADGSDRNDGLSEEKAVRSLFKALNLASRTPAKTIIVLGQLDLSSEQSSSPERVFLIQGTGKEQITIRGQDRAVLSGRGTERRVVLIRGISNICFEDIEISGGGGEGEGGGIGIGESAELTLGPGSLITGNRSGALGGGIAIAPGGRLYIRGGMVNGNETAGVGGGIAAAGAVLVMESGEIRDNTAEGGGGVAVYEGGSFTLKSGAVLSNRASVGGGIILNRGGVFVMEGGELGGNASEGSGGALALIDRCVFTLKNGEIRGNTSGQYGGAVASDDSSLLELLGGSFKTNTAESFGGGLFVSGNFTKASESGCVIYGNNAAEDSNRAREGAAVYVLGGLVRETSAGPGVLLNSGSAGVEGGWENAAGVMEPPSGWTSNTEKNREE